MSVYKNKVYVFGGVYNNEKVSNDLWVFDAINDTWTQVTTTGDIPPPVNEHSSCVADDRMYVYGGNDFQGIIYSSLYVLDLQTLEWSLLQSSAEKSGPSIKSLSWEATRTTMLIVILTISKHMNHSMARKLELWFMNWT